MNAKDAARAAGIADRIEAMLATDRQSMDRFFRGDLRIIARAIRELQKREAKP
jgi:hypothetical protein